MLSQSQVLNCYRVTMPPTLRQNRLPDGEHRSGPNQRLVGVIEVSISAISP